MWICRRIVGIDSSSIIAHPIYTTGTIAKIRCQEVDISIIDRYNSFDNRYGFFVSNGNTTKVGSQNFGYQIWFCTRLIRNWLIFWCASPPSRPASACRSSGRHLGKFAWGSNLALVFEAVQSRPSTTFPESWHDYWKQYFRSIGRGICLPDSPNWRYRQNYDLSKWQVWIREAFLGRISA